MTPQRTKQAIIALTRLSRVPGLSEEVDTKIQTAITQLVDSAPEALNTLNELAAALNDNENAYNTLMGAIQSHDSRRDNPHRVTKEQVGLGSLPNARSDKYDPSESEPVANSTSSLVLATTRAVSRLKDYLVRLINGKANSSHTHTSSQVGLGNLPNAKSDSTSSTNRNVLATSRAVRDAKVYAMDWRNHTHKPLNYPPSTHFHDDRYYTEAEVRSLLAGKANSNHTHTPTQVGLGGGITATRRVRDESGRTETVTIRNGIITAWRDSRPVPRPTPPRPPSGGGCIAMDTPVLMANGTTKTLELLQVGDQVQSLHIPQLTEENYTTWTGALEGASKTTARVISKTLFPDQPCLRINGELRMTAASEYVFCRRSTETHWQFLTADELQQGDYLLDSSLEAVRITTIATEKKPVPVGHINVEPDDLFFAHGLLIHNTEPRYK